MDYLDLGKLKELRSRVRKFLNSPEEDETRLPVIEEIEVLIELSEQNRRKQGAFGLFPSQQQDNKTNTESIDLRNQNDVLTSKIQSIEKLNTGNILDAQDYLGQWHLSIIIDQKDN